MVEIGVPTARAELIAGTATNELTACNVGAAVAAAGIANTAAAVAVVRDSGDVSLDWRQRGARLRYQWQ